MDLGAKVGETAGTIWHLLHERGPQTLSQLKKAVKEPSELVLFAVGWLAREGNVDIAADKRGFKASLRQPPPA
jgi:hypothetical protein